MQGCLSSALFGLLLYVASWFVLHSIAHCQAEPSRNPLQLDLSAECAPEVELRRRTLTVEGAPGIWFAEPVAACMAGQLRAVPVLIELVELYMHRAEESDAMIDALKRQLELGREIEDRLDASLEVALRRQREAEESRSRLSRRPALWFALGVVSTGALMFAAGAARR